MYNANLNSETIPILQEQKYENGITKYGSDSKGNQKDLDSKSLSSIYPKAVFFVLGSKFFESFAANGVRTILALYMRDSLGFSEDFSTSVLHIFNFFSQFSPLLGAVLADSYFGDSRTIFYLFFLYFTGFLCTILITIPISDIPVTEIVFIGLLLISLGNGGIRACVTSLGGAQFRLPQQQKKLESYFSHYYFVYTMGILISKLAPPAVRAETSCFGKSNCYTAVFGLLMGSFLLAWAVFLFGLRFYVPQTASGTNIFCKVLRCIKMAMWECIQGRRPPDSTHWLDGSQKRFGKQFVEDVKGFLKVLVLFIPLPIYWALTAQQDSSWTFQATQLDTQIGILRIEPDQVKALGPALLLILIPIVERIMPFFNRCGLLVCPLQKVRLGGLMAALSFVCAGILQIRIEAYPTISPSVCWQIPQFLLLMLGEVLLSIPGLQFSFTQAPKSMKSVLTASWFVNNAIGNLIVVIITEIKPVKLQSNEFFLYAILMGIGIICFALMASRYNKQKDTESNMPTYKQTAV